MLKTPRLARSVVDPVARARVRGGAVVLMASALLARQLALAASAHAPTVAAPGTWSRTADMSVERAGHTATLLRDGRVLMAGGSDGRTFLRSAELYDAATATWSNTGPLADARARHSATLLDDEDSRRRWLQHRGRASGLG